MLCECGGDSAESFWEVRGIASPCSACGRRRPAFCRSKSVAPVARSLSVDVYFMSLQDAAAAAVVAAVVAAAMSLLLLPSSSGGGGGVAVVVGEAAAVAVMMGILDTQY